MSIYQDNNNAWFLENAIEGISTSFKLTQPQPLHSQKTPFQQIDVYETATFGKLLVFDGIVMLTERDNFFYHEMVSHPALRLHPHPKQVVIIGGGDCGTLHEVLKHPEVEQLIQIEIDEAVTQVAELFFPTLCASNHDKRVTFHFDDGITWMANAPNNSVDIILIDSTDPINHAEGLFKAPFYDDCLRVLRHSGILAQQSGSPFLHRAMITAMHHDLKKVGFTKTKLISFPQPAYPSGLWSITLATAEPWNEPRTDKLISTNYYNNELLHSRPLFAF